jgi:twitching motility protein PilT
LADQHTEHVTRVEGRRPAPANESRAMNISELLLFTQSKGASDLHVSAGEPPMVRLHGEMKRVNVPPLSAEQVREMIYEILNDQQRRTFEERHEIDFSIELRETARFRVNVFVQRRGMAAVMRTIPITFPTFEKLRLPPVLRKVAKLDKGLVLVTGPTGSGKSTTLAAMIDLINSERAGHILTVEDPIEFVHTSKSCMVNQREIGPHSGSFASALRAALREDPDVILVGEMRDLESISLALTAAETGHLVLGTLHTVSAPKTIDRVINVFPAQEQDQIRTIFSESIQAVVSQVLLRTADGQGRVAAVEVMLGTPAIRNLIREHKIAQMVSAMQTSVAVGMQTMDQALKDLVIKKVVTKDEAMTRATSPATFLASEGPPRS